VYLGYIKSDLLLYSCFYDFIDIIVLTDLMRDIYVTLPKLRRQGPYVTMTCRDPFTVLDSDDLLVYAPFVRVLSVMATTLPMFDLILKNDALLSILQGCVRRLDLYFVSERNYAPSNELVTLLVRHGNLREFSLFSAQLPLQQLSEILSVAADQTSCTAGVDANQVCLPFSKNETVNQFSPSDEEFATDPVVEVENSGSSMLDEDVSDMEACPGLDESRDSSDIYCFPLDGDSTECSNVQELDDLYNVAVLSSHSSIQSRRAQRTVCDSRKSAKVVSDVSHGCVSLTLAYLKHDYVVQEALSHVLPLWSSLKKLAILEVNC